MLNGITPNESMSESSDELTPKENFAASNYKNSEVTFKRALIRRLSFIIPSIVLMIVWLITKDPAYAYGRSYTSGAGVGVHWDWELQFYNATNHLASVYFQGGAFSGDGGQIYDDETGVLEKLYGEIIEQSENRRP
jgi:hypothetical protein